MHKIHVKVEQQHIDAALNGSNPHSSTQCPVARALRDAISVDDVSAGSHYYRLDNANAITLIGAFPGVAQSWIANFDSLNGEEKPFEFDLEVDDKDWEAFNAKNG